MLFIKSAFVTGCVAWHNITEYKIWHIDNSVSDEIYMSHILGYGYG